MNKNFAIFVALLALAASLLAASLERSFTALAPLVTLPLAAWVAARAKPFLFKLRHTHAWAPISIALLGGLLTAIGGFQRSPVLWSVGIALILVLPFAACAEHPAQRQRLV